MSKEYIDLDNEEYFDKKVYKHEVLYITKNYPDPIAIDCKVKKMNPLIIANRAPTINDKVNFYFWIDDSVSPWRFYENTGNDWIAK